MELFIVSLPDGTPGDVSQLYYRVRKGELRQEGGSWELPDGSSVSLDTYFNIFSSSKYSEYTDVEVVSFSAAVSGRMRVDLHILSSAKDEIVKSVDVDSEIPVEVTLDFDISGLDDRDPVCHYISFESRGSRIHRWGSYRSDVVPKDVTLTAVICTFNRETFVTETIRRIDRMLTDGRYSLGGSLKVCLVDNGRTLSRNACTNDAVTILHNPNLGGSGGFTRGMLEALENGSTHVLLMDDDEIVDPNVIYKTLNILRTLKDAHKDAFVLGGMLITERPTIQFEAGALVRRNLVPLKNGLDMSLPGSLLENDRFERADYGAWWYACIPAHICREELPLPLFIRMDDVEFGIRHMRDHMVMNGIGIWHADFDLRKKRIFDRYYGERNMMIVESVHGLKGHPLFLKTAHHILRYLSASDPATIEMYTRAVNDYLSGVDFIRDTDGESLNRELHAMDDDTVEYRACPALDPVMIARNILRPRYVRATADLVLTYMRYMITHRRVRREYRRRWRELARSEYWNGILSRP